MSLANKTRLLLARLIGPNHRSFVARAGLVEAFQFYECFVTVDWLQLRRIIAIKPRTFQHFGFRQLMFRLAILEHHVQSVATTHERYRAE